MPSEAALSGERCPRKSRGSFAEEATVPPGRKAHGERISRHWKLRADFALFNIPPANTSLPFLPTQGSAMSHESVGSSGPGGLRIFLSLGYGSEASRATATACRTTSCQDLSNLSVILNACCRAYQYGNRDSPLLLVRPAQAYKEASQALIC